MNDHPLHEKIYSIVEPFDGKNNNTVHVYADHACSGKEGRVSLFLEPTKKRENHICDVDSLIVRGDKIKIILEIEESGRQPVRIFGKVLASAIATHFCPPEKPLPDGISKDRISKDKNVLFIQIISSSGLKKNSRRKEQWKQIGKYLERLVRDGHVKGIKGYKMLIGEDSDFEDNSEKAIELTTILKSLLKGG